MKRRMLPILYALALVGLAGGLILHAEGLKLAGYAALILALNAQIVRMVRRTPQDGESRREGKALTGVRWIRFALMIAAICISVVGFAAGRIAAYEGEIYTYSATYEPNVFVADVDYPSSIDGIFVTDSRLYLYYSRHELVKAYDLAGNYLYSINFEDNKHSGGGVLTVTDDGLMYQPKEKPWKTYLVKNDELTLQTADDADAQTSARTRPGHQDAAGNQYLLRGSDIVKATPDGTSTVLIHCNPLVTIMGHDVFYTVWGWLLILLFASYCFVLPPRSDSRIVRKLNARAKGQEREKALN